ncbi:MAG: polysaccharide deacetylase family protein [Bacteroidota bacterium]
MRNILFKFLRYSGLPILFREVFQKNRVTILLFHDISKETADNTFPFLRKKYNLIDLNDFLNAVEYKELISLPKKALIITFDDGHIGNYKLLPLIKKSKVPVSIFLCAAIINTNRSFWFTYKPSEDKKGELKKIINSERLAILNEFGYNQEEEHETPQALNKSQIMEMKEQINFQSHTLFHPILTQCSLEDARKEIFDSKMVLETEYDLNITALSYPNGDYSKREIDIVKEAGYSCGITVDYGFNSIKTDLYKLRRISVKDTFTMDELIVKSSGVWGFLKLFSK